MEQEQSNPEAEPQQPQPPATEPTPQNDATGGGQQPAGDGDGHVFTQADLNRLVPERGRQYFRSMLTELGVGDPDELKGALDRLKEIEQEQLTERERLEQQAQQAAEQARQAQEQRDRAEERARDTLIQAAIMAQAAAQGASHPEDAYHLADLGVISIDAETSRVEGADKAVKALIEAGRLPLRGRPQAPSLDAGAGSGERTGDRAPALSDEELEVARKLRLTPEDYQKGKSVGG